MKGLIITIAITLLILGGGILILGGQGNSSAPKPKAVSESILVKSDSYQTNPGAKVTIVEFGDYRCPACRQAFPGMQQILKDYGSKINFVFRNYAFLPDSPTNSNPNASVLAANAALCAGDQGKFWQMHDYLYTNQPSETDISIYTIDKLTNMAQTIGLDANKFKTCLTNKTHDAQVKSDFADGQLAGVTGTPAFFVNGISLIGVPSYSDLKSAIDPLLK